MPPNYYSQTQSYLTKVNLVDTYTTRGLNHIYISLSCFNLLSPYFFFTRQLMHILGRSERGGITLMLEIHLQWCTYDIYVYVCRWGWCDREREGLTYGHTREDGKKNTTNDRIIKRCLPLNQKKKMLLFFNDHPCLPSFAASILLVQKVHWSEPMTIKNRQHTPPYETTANSPFSL